MRAIGVKALRVSMIKRAAAPWKELWLSRIFNETALHAPLDEFGFTFCHPVPSFCCLCYSSCANHFVPFWNRSWSCQRSQTYHATSLSLCSGSNKNDRNCHWRSDLVPEFAARKRVPSFEKFSMITLFSLNQLLEQSSRLSPPATMRLPNIIITMVFFSATLLQKLVVFRGTSRLDPVQLAFAT